MAAPDPISVIWRHVGIDQKRPLSGFDATQPSVDLNSKTNYIRIKANVVWLDNAVPRVGLTRDKIIEAASKLSDEEGFDSLTLASIARLFGVRLPSLYGHVASVHALKTGVALLALQRLAERTEEAVAGRAGKDALAALVDTHRGFAREHPGLFHASRYPLDGESAAESGGARLARVYHATLRGYGLGDADRVHATRLIGSFVLGFSLLELAGSFSHSAPDAELSWRRDIDGLDALFKSWAKQKNDT